MSESVHYFNMFVGVGAIVLQIFSLAVIFSLPFTRENKFLEFLKRNFILIGFVISFSGVLISSFYSEVLNYVPCFHCWIQRVFMFPQALLFGVAWLRKDKNVFWYSLPLTIIGFVDALYLIYIYYFAINPLPCDASGISCTLHYVSEFGGYISIPTIAFSGFAAMLSLLLVVRFYKRDQVV